MLPVINGYSIIREIKPAGAWANVYLAEFEGRKVALKILKKRYADNFSTVKSFINEAETIKKFNHPNLPQVIDICNPSSQPYYFSMEYYSRGNLDSYIKNRKILSTNEIVEISIQICRALNAINAEGHLHLDLKPSNVLFGNNNRVIVTDFGSSRSLLHLNDAEARTGTPQFMSPEQFDSSSDLTFASDLYSLGIIMYYMATGQLPFSSNDIQQLEMLHSTIDPIPVRQMNPDAHKKVESIINKLLSKKIQNRYQTALSLIKDLDQVVPDVTYFYDGIRIDQLDSTSRVIKSKKYYHFPVTISSKPDTEDNFKLITHKIYKKLGNVETLDDGLMRLSLTENHDFSINDNFNSDNDFYLYDKITRISNKSLNLQFEKINSEQSHLTKGYFFAGAAGLLLIAAIYLLITLLPAGSKFSIYDLELSSAILLPNENFSFNFNSNLDSASYIESIIIAPYGKEDPAIERIKPDQMFYKYSFSDIREGEKEFPFTVKAIDNNARESNWIEKKVIVKNLSDQLRLTNLSLPDRIRQGQTIRYNFEHIFSIPEEQVLIEVTLEKGNRIIIQNTTAMSMLERSIITNETGDFNLKIRAYDKNRSLFSNLLDGRIRITENYPDPTISVTSQRKENSYILLGFQVEDVVYRDRAEIIVQFVINGQVIDLSANEYSVRYSINSPDNFVYFLRARTPDGRSSKTQEYYHSTIPPPRISFTSPPRLRPNNRISFAYLFNDQVQLDPTNYTIKLVVNGYDEHILSTTENSYEFTVESEGEYSLYLVLDCRDGRRAVSEIKKVIYSNI